MLMAEQSTLGIIAIALRLAGFVVDVAHGRWRDRKPVGVLGRCCGDFASENNVPTVDQRLPGEDERRWVG